PLYLSPFLHRQPRRPATATLFPYTTLFRSIHTFNLAHRLRPCVARRACQSPLRLDEKELGTVCPGNSLAKLRRQVVVKEQFSVRSEEHTSELQSRENLVCRLLLEKKK